MIMVIIIKIVNDKKNTPSFHAKYFPGNYGALMKKNITISSISMSKNFPIFRKGKKNTEQQGLNALGSNQNTTLFHFQNIFIMIDLDIKITYPKLTAITTKISIHMHTQIYTFTHINHI